VNLDSRLPFVESSETLVLNISWIGAGEKAKLKHKLNYKVRPYEVDLAEYLEEHKAKNYNKDFVRLCLSSRTQTRVFGYWVTLSNLSKFGSRDSGHYCPICGAEMEYIDYFPKEKLDYEDWSLFFEQRGYRYKILEPPPPLGSDLEKELDKIDRFIKKQEGKIRVKTILGRFSLSKKETNQYLEVLEEMGTIYFPRSGNWFKKVK